MSRRFVASFATVAFFGACALANESAAPIAKDEARDLGGRANFDARPPAATPAPAMTLERSAGNAAAVDATARPDRAIAQASSLATTMIIRTGQASIEVDSLELAIRRIGEIAIASGGYLANTSVQTGENAPRTASLEVKLPADRYQGTFDRLSEVGKVRSAMTSAQDVGEEYVDVTARVGNAKKLEDRLINLLATRTGKLDDVLSVERELARVREEIERYEGRLRWLRTQVAMSTLTVAVFEPGPVVGGPGENVILEAIKQSWRNFVQVVAAGIALIGGLLPVVIFVGGGLVLARTWWRRIRRSAPSAAVT